MGAHVGVGRVHRDGHKPLRLAAWDPLAAGVMADPYPAYAALRAAGPVCRVGPASWGVTHHREVFALLRDPRLANVLPVADPQLGGAESALQRLLPARTPEEHRDLHEAVVGTMGGPAAFGRRDRLVALVDELLSPAMDNRSIDAVADVAYPVAATMACELIGLPADTVSALWPRVGDLGRAFTPFLSEGQRGAADTALQWLRSRVEDQLDQPADDDGLLSRARRLPGLDRADLVANLAFIFFTAFETTMDMLATGCLCLSQDMEAQSTLRYRPELIPRAVEEFVRWDSPIQYTARLALETIHLDGHTIRPHRPVFLLLGCANHDERVFRSPDHLDVMRRPNPHVAFGGGVRGCVGAALARLEGHVVFRRLLETFTTVSLADEPIRHPSVLFRRYRSIPLALTVG